MILWNFVEVRGERQGTGYFIAEDRVLTSRHVVGEREQIRLLGQKPDGPAEWNGKTIWCGGGGFDVAVVEVEKSSATPPGLSGLEDRPLEVDHQRWSSRGYVVGAFGSSKERLAQIALSGEAFAHTESAVDFQINLETQAEQVDDWQGISGAPVFLRGRILGVIQSVSTSFPQSPRAIALSPLLESDPDFRSAIRWRESHAKEQWEKIAGQIRSILARDEAAAAQVAGHLEAWQGTYQKAHVDRLADTLCKEVGFDGALRAVYKAQKSFQGAREAGRKSVRTLEVLLGWLLPLHCERHFMGQVVSMAGSAWLSLPIATPPVAEIYMAWLEGRALNLERPEEPTGPSRPTLMIPTLPETGSDVDLGAAEMALDLERRMRRDPQLQASFEGWADRLAGRFLSKANAAELAGQKDYVKRVIGRVRDVLQFKAEYQDQRHYLIFDRDYALKHQALLRKLGQQLPMLLQLELTGDADQADFEFRTLLPLHDLLYRIHQDPA